MTLKFKITSLLFFLLVSINSSASSPPASISSSSTSGSQDKRLDKIENDVDNLKDMRKTYEDYYKTAYGHLEDMMHDMEWILGIGVAIFIGLQIFGVKIIVDQSIKDVRVELTDKIQELEKLTSELMSKQKEINKGIEMATQKLDNLTNTGIKEIALQTANEVKAELGEKIDKSKNDLDDKIKIAKDELNNKVIEVNNLAKGVGEKYASLETATENAKKNIEKISNSSTYNLICLINYLEFLEMAQREFQRDDFKEARKTYLISLRNWQLCTSDVKDRFSPSHIMRRIAYCIYWDLKKQSEDNLDQRFKDELLKEIKKKEYANTDKYVDNAYDKWKDTILKDCWDDIITELKKPASEKE